MVISHYQHSVESHGMPFGIQTIIRGSYPLFLFFCSED